MIHRTILACISMFVIIVPQAYSQSSVLGVITSLQSKEMIVGARVKFVSSSDVNLVLGGYSNNKGKYEIKNISNGKYTVSISSIGYKTFTEIVSVNNEQNQTYNFALEELASRTDEVVITASRKQEKALDAPASVSVVDGREIREHPTSSAAEQLRGVSGMDIVQKGIGQNEIAVRGFTNVFSGNALVLSDGRITGVPSLRANIPYFISSTNDDIDRIEVVRGPGSALFGPNAAQGVVNIITRSPIASVGTTINAGFGERSLMTFGARHAGTAGEHFGYKLSASYLGADDWLAVDSTEISARAKAITLGAISDTLLIGKRDNRHERFTADARVDYIFSDNTNISVSGGIAQAIKSIEMTDLGAGQARDWRYMYANVQLNSKELLAQFTFNKSDAGKTYLVRTGDPIIDRSSLIIGKIQHVFQVNELWDLTYGADIFLTTPITDKTITGRNEDSDNLTEIGGYVQSNYEITKDKLNFIVAARIDKHNMLESPFISPRTAFLYKIDENNTVRLTYNRAFQTPTTNDLFLDLVASTDAFGLGAYNPAWAVAVRASGSGKTGFHFDYAPNGQPLFVSQFDSQHNKLSSADATPMWDAAKAIVSGGIAGNTQLDSTTRQLLIQFLAGTPNPNGQQVGSYLALLNPTSKTFAPASGVVNLERLRPTVNQTFEIGYTGNINSKLSASVDVYYSKIKDFIGSQQVITPNVFYKGADVKAYYKPMLKAALLARGMPEPQAEGTAEAASTEIAGGFAQIPIGTVSPIESVDPTAILLASRNYGDVSLWGMDISLEWKPTRMITFRGTLSSVNLLGDSAVAEKSYYNNLDGISDLALNSPQYKSSLSANYRADDGYTIGAQWRWNGGFFMNSGAYIGTVSPYSLIDISASYKLPFATGVTVFISADNILDNKVQQFVGAPAIGRLLSGRLSYSF